jgi:SWIB/MDM2 domain
MQDQPGSYTLFQQQIARLDQLERKLESRVTSMRRRMNAVLLNYEGIGNRSNGNNAHIQYRIIQQRQQGLSSISNDAPNSVITLDHQSSMYTSYRRSRLRLFATHSVTSPDVGDTSHSAGREHERGSLQWTLRLEGKLLIDHLDHVAAQKFDARTNYVEPTEELDRSKLDPEEPPIPAVRCTHFFDSMEIQFQTIYQPVVESARTLSPQSLNNSSALSRKKVASRRTSAEMISGSREEMDIDASLVSSPPTTLTWSRDQASDSGGWMIPYQSPPSPLLEGFSADKRYVVHSVVAQIKLCPHCGTGAGGSNEPFEPLYEVAPVLAQAMFPNHSSADADGANKNSESGRKRRIDEPDSSLPSLFNDAHIPLGLTWSDIASGFFTYIRDRGLCDEEDYSRVVCNETLASIMGCRSFPFSELFTRLVQRQLIQTCHQLPIRLNYVMEVATALPSPAAVPVVPAVPPSLLQVDVDVWVPELFPYRVRELMRRMKRRELEYTSSRTKAKNSVVGSRRTSIDEDLVRQRLDQIVTGRAVGPDHIPILAALAQAAPANTAARYEAVLDARISYLLGCLAEHQNAADNAQYLLQTCRQFLE